MPKPKPKKVAAAKAPPTKRAVQARLDLPLYDRFALLIDHRAKELQSQGVTVTGESVMRWLILLKCDELGIEVPPSASATA